MPPRPPPVLKPGVRAISLDVTGTLIRHRDPIAETYSSAMRWADFLPISAEQLAPAFKQAYKQTCLEHPCFGAGNNFSSRQWWVTCVERCLANVGARKINAGREGDRSPQGGGGASTTTTATTTMTYTQPEFDRFFRRVYQHYGCPDGYTQMADARSFVEWASHQGYLLGVTTNTPCRTMDSVLPFMGLHRFFRTFVCSQDVGVEKPGAGIFERSFAEMEAARANVVKNGLVDSTPGGNGRAGEISNSYAALLRSPTPLRPEEILHIGDSLAADFCGARSFGWQALHLDRSADKNVRVYQDWLQGPDYANKTEEDIVRHSVTDLDGVRQALETAES